MNQLKERLLILRNACIEASEILDINRIQQEVDELEEQSAQPELWNDPARATSVNKRLSQLKSTVDPWVTLSAQVEDLFDMLELSDDLYDEFDGQIKAMEDTYKSLRRTLLFSGEYDNYAAVVRITAGTGGTDAQDFTEMLERMYLRWAERSDFKTTMLERSSGEEAGVKTVVFEVEGPYAYGRLQSENGVHRLVRLSPFNSDNLRQTSFALVEILPQIDDRDTIDISMDDVRIDVYRASGKGGQGVNTTDSAVRVTHVPTGVTVAIQNERSQIQNKETALKVLRGKLLQMQIEQDAEKIDELRAGESASWGSQIRNYVLHPYSLVKDTRTKQETANVQDVLDGDIDQFMWSFLESKQRDKSHE